MTKFQSGVLTGKQVQDVFTDANFPEPLEP